MSSKPTCLKFSFFPTSFKVKNGICKAVLTLPFLLQKMQIPLLCISFLLFYISQWWEEGSGMHPDWKSVLARICNSSFHPSESLNQTAEKILIRIHYQPLPLSLSLLLVYLLTLNKAPSHTLPHNLFPFCTLNLPCLINKPMVGF